MYFQNLYSALYFLENNSLHITDSMTLRINSFIYPQLALNFKLEIFIHSLSRSAESQLIYFPMKYYYNFNNYKVIFEIAPCLPNSQFSNSTLNSISIPRNVLVWTLSSYFFGD
jgi:hypothetical protein